jgi:hypothetical protein
MLIVTKYIVRRENFDFAQSMRFVVKKNQYLRSTLSRNSGRILKYKCVRTQVQNNRTFNLCHACITHIESYYNILLL